MTRRFLVGSCSDWVTLQDGSDCPLGDVSLGENVCTAVLGVEARVTGYETLHVKTLPPEHRLELYNSEATTPSLPGTAQVLTRREITVDMLRQVYPADTQASVVAAYAGNLDIHTLLTPPVWRRVDALTAADYIAFPFHSGSDDIGNFDALRDVVDILPVRENRAINFWVFEYPWTVNSFHVQRPWCTFESSDLYADTVLNDGNSLYFRLRSRTTASMHDAVHLAVDSVGSIIVSGVAVRSGLQHSQKRVEGTK